MKRSRIPHDSLVSILLRCLSTLMPLAVLVLFLPLSGHAAQFTVLEVLSGDMIRAAGHGTEITVRLAGIDAPELCSQDDDLAQPFSAEARDYLEKLTLRKTVSLKSYGEIRYGIYWGEIFLGPKNINLEMLRSGYAETSREDSPKRFNLAPYFQIEKQARAAKRGIWAQGKEYISPSTWRKRQKARCSFATILYELLHRKGKK
jgi:micrococcal nuclease